MRKRRRLQRFGVLTTLFLTSLLAPRLSAQQAHPVGDTQVAAVKQVVQTAGLGFPIAPLQASRREDLERLLAAAGKRPGADVDSVSGDIAFYEMQAPPGPALDYDPNWIVAVARATGDVYRLNGFEASPRPGGPTQEFNRLTSQLALSISTANQAVSLGRLFLQCCVGGDRSDIVVDPDGLRRIVQDYYYKTYGDVWRMLDAYVQWQRASRIGAPELAPKIALSGGVYRIAVKTVRTVAGRAPQLEDASLEISRDGSVRLLAIQPIFPKVSNWLFYDVVKPSFCSKATETVNLASRGCDTLPGEWYGLAAQMEDGPIKR